MNGMCVAFFVDHSNFYSGLLQQFGDGRIDYVKLVHRILGDRTLISFSLYTGVLDAGRQPVAAQRQQKFFRALGGLPFPVTFEVAPIDWIVFSVR